VKMLSQDGRRMLYRNLRRGPGRFAGISSSSFLYRRARGRWRAAAGAAFFAGPRLYPGACKPPPHGSGAYQHLQGFRVAVHRNEGTRYDGDITRSSHKNTNCPHGPP
jgi:hypothetical protein